ncbi:hypothetical protein D3C87_2026370 [compost metagenome]
MALPGDGVIERFGYAPRCHLGWRPTSTLFETHEFIETREPIANFAFNRHDLIAADCQVAPRSLHYPHETAVQL